MKLNYFSAILVSVLTIFGAQSCQEKPAQQPNEDLGLTQCLTPANLSFDVDGFNVECSWTVAKDAQAYNLVVASDETFESVVETFVVAPEEVPYIVTLAEGVYYFKLQATAEGVDPSNWAVYESAITIVDATPAVDLSATATANCYIVNAAGKYKFKPTKGCTADAVGEITEIQLLWETSTEAADAALAPNSVISKVSYKDGYIEFATPSVLKPGNALIAAVQKTTEVNAETQESVEKSTVLWSWHIWLTSETISDVTFADGLVLMDRNIGELSATARTSMLYQWGRKDPFPGTIGADKKVAVAGVATTSRTDNSSVDYSIKNPTTLGAAKTVSESTVQSVHSDYYKRLWGTDVNDKTLHDPCPAGYKVPWAFEGGVDGIKSDNKIENTRFAALAGLTYANNAFSMASPAISFYGGGFYNFNGGTGASVSADMQMSGDSFTIWTATCRADAKKRSAGCLHGDANGIVYHISLNDNAVLYNGRAAAWPVRCEKISAN